MQQGGDPWYTQYEDCKKQADKCLSMLQERQTKHAGGGQEASRLTSQIRREISRLEKSLNSLRELLGSPESQKLTEKERNVRRDMTSILRNSKDEMLLNMRKSSNAHIRDDLLGSSSQGPLQPAQETSRTAELDNKELVQLQRQVMREQDEDLDELERTVGSTKHIALAIHEELGLQERLLDELDEDVDVSHSRLRAAQKKLSIVMKQSGMCKTTLLTIALMLIFMVVVIVCFKLVKYL